FPSAGETTSPSSRGMSRSGSRKNQRLKPPSPSSRPAAVPHTAATTPCTSRTVPARTRPAPRKPTTNGMPSRAIFIRSVDPAGRTFPRDRFHPILEHQLLLLEHDFLDLLFLGEEQ